MYILHRAPQDLECVNIGDVEFGDEEEHVEDEPQEEDEEDEMLFPKQEPGVTRIHQEDNRNQLLDDDVCLTYSKCLLILAKARIPPVCQIKGCKQEIDITQKFVGSAVYLTWVCSMIVTFVHT